MSDRCKGCEAPVMWVKMETGGRMLVNLPAEKRVILGPQGAGGKSARIVDTYTAHFATCPKADTFRRERDR